MGIGVGTPSRIIDLLDAGMSWTKAFSLAASSHADRGRGVDVIEA